MQRLTLHKEIEAAPAERRARAPLERCTADDRLHDYVLGGYEPLVPATGKLRSVNLLFESFALLGVEAEGVALVESLRRELGSFRTVWGIKHRRGRPDELAWELYFYDFERVHADLSIERIRRLLAPHLTVDAEEPRPLPWHMFSVEFDRAQLTTRAPAPAHVYIDMRCYELRGRQMTLENVYTFHDPRKEIDEVLHRLRSSVHFHAGSDSLARLMPPPLFHCGRICVANKRATDALYFSRIPTPALGDFLVTHAWPEAIAGWVRGRAGELDHLLWDVGVDFHSGEGRATPLKTGLYGDF